MPGPPDLGDNFRSAAERAAAQAEVRQLGLHLREVMAAADGTGPIPGWLDAELGKPLRGHVEPPEVRLARYRAVFGDELQAFDEALTSEENGHLDDDSLRAARYLARRLLGALLDCVPEDVHDRLPAAN
jgi:hypothetical protein